MEAVVIPNKLEVDLHPPWKLVEASMDVDCSRWKSIWNLPWKLAEASMEVDGSRWKSIWNPPWKLVELPWK